MRDRSPPPPRPMADSDDTAIDDTVADRTLIVDTVADRTLIVDMDRTETGGPARPRPMTADEEETQVNRPDDAAPMEELRSLGRTFAAVLFEVGRWLTHRVLRPGIRGLEGGLKRLAQLLRSSRGEDSDAYSRRRGQQWRRFREGDASINELREFDAKQRGTRDRRS